MFEKMKLQMPFPPYYMPQCKNYSYFISTKSAQIVSADISDKLYAWKRNIFELMSCGTRQLIFVNGF